MSARAPRWSADDPMARVAATLAPVLLALIGARHARQGVGALYLFLRTVLDAWIEAHPVDAINARQEPEDDGYERGMPRRGLVPGAATAQRGRR